MQNEEKLHDLAAEEAASRQDRTTEAGQAQVNPEERREREESQETPGFTVNDRRFWNLDAEELEQEDAKPRAPTYVEQLQSQLEEKDRQLREYIAAYKKEVVEGLEQTKARLERDSQEQAIQLRGQVAEPMMEVLDALERSVAAAEASPSVETVLEGIRMVHLLMVQKLQELGLTRIQAVGTPFDPRFHEAVGVVPITDAAQDNMVLAELKPGFMLGDRLVRPAMVQVGRST
jgi:molecular chaperone GrpE